jgi:GH24 family phage-related lysozyme (muramidase)
VQTADGKSGYVSADYVSIHYSDGTSTGGNGGSGSGTGTSASALSLSSVSQTVPVGKTLYLKATTNPSGADAAWTSSNTSIATVVNGYVTAVAKGSAVITAKSGSATATCSVTVSDAEPVRTAYASPNIVAPGESVTLTAVTDLSRDGAQFVVTGPDGKTATIAAGSSSQETANGVAVKVWKATASLSGAGNYTVLAESRSGGAYSSTGFTTSACVASKNDKSTTTSEERRVSDDMVRLISKWEGYRASVYTDTISSSQVPTIGYGCTLGSNAEFYNGIGETEAWSMMVNKINSSSYTSELNKMIKNNGFLMNQYQADCLISFAYNVGSGYFNSSTDQDFVKIMKNAVQPPDFSSGASYEATVTQDTQVRNNSGILSAQTGTVTAGTSVTVTGGDFSDPKDGWYQVKLADGTAGWVNAGYVSLACSGRLVHDLHYTNAYAFGTELIRWNKAGGKFYTALFYRRLGEANVYNYGDYNALRYNKYGYGYPSAASSLQ